jgi:CRP-like cAMP-binding protein
MSVPENINKTPASISPCAGEAQEKSAPGIVTVHLCNIPVLSGVDEATLLKLASVMQVRNSEKGQHLLHKGSAGEHLLFLINGRLQAIDITEDGREVGLSFLMPGDYFGELSVIDGLPRSASVVACEPSIYALLPRQHALDLIYNNPLVAERVLKRFAGAIRQASNFRTILGIPNAFQRVYALLAHLAQKGNGGLIVIEKLPTQQEISIMINTSRETVSRAIQNLVHRGVVEKDLRRLIVRQPEVLNEEISNANPAPLQEKR